MTAEQAPNRICEAVTGFRNEHGELPGEVYLPSDVYDAGVDTALVWFPSIKFIREPEFEACLLVMRDPLEVN